MFRGFPPDGPFCFCLEPFDSCEWLAAGKLDAWIEANPGAWAMIPQRLKRHLVNHSAKAPETPYPEDRFS